MKNFANKIAQICASYKTYEISEAWKARAHELYCKNDNKHLNQNWLNASLALLKKSRFLSQETSQKLN